MWRNKKEPVAIQIEDKLISSELKDQLFACDLSACKGACCVEGDLGAPLEPEELEILEDIYPEVKPFLREQGIEAIEQQGTSVIDFTGEYSTPLVKGRECAYVTFTENGTALCGIEQAHRVGKIEFQKPISCHLYPVRVSKLSAFEALNYDRWDICSAACSLGAKTGIPVYKFVKHALIRKYGQEFYDNLAAILEGHASD
ncbi:MAG: DUF3109 family protein [Bacteroidota bacterium]